MPIIIDSETKKPVINKQLYNENTNKSFINTVRHV